MTTDDRIIQLEMSMQELARQLAEVQRSATESNSRRINTEIEIDLIKSELERYKLL